MSILFSRLSILYVSEVPHFEQKVLSTVCEEIYLTGLPILTIAQKEIEAPEPPEFDFDFQDGR